MSHSNESYLALFCRQIWRTLEILEKDQDKNDDKKQNQDNAYIVLTLSGFTNDFGSSWHTKARENCKRIKDPYVRAMINFLTIPYNENRNAFYLCEGTIIEPEVFEGNALRISFETGPKVHFLTIPKWT